MTENASRVGDSLEPKPTYAWQIVEFADERSQFQPNLTVRLVVQMQRATDTGPEWVLTSDPNPYANLRLDLWLSANALDMLSYIGYNQPLGYKEPWFVDLTRAMQMAKTLQRVEKHCDKLDEKWGRPRGFAERVLRIDDALGFHLFRWQGPLGRYEYAGPAGAADHIRSIIWHFQKKCQGTA